VNDIKKIIKYAHTSHNIPVLIDGAQAVAHFPVDVRDLDCDFFVFSAHKMYGPTGVGILYGKKKYLKLMQPCIGGGDMVLNVNIAKTIYKELPHKFEAGTPNIANIIAFGATLDFLNSISFCAIIEHERIILEYALNKLTSLKGLHIVGSPINKIGVVSFNLSNIHSHDVCTILDKKNIALRSGHLCAMPLMRFFKLNSMARVSFGIYNTKDDVDSLYNALLYVKKFFKV
jgi:cysteine desulfurase/selenocysteine lyase